MVKYGDICRIFIAVLKTTIIIVWIVTYSNCMLWAYLSEVREAVEYLIDKYNLSIYNTTLYTKWR
jgi:hypothetical protein